MYIIEEVDEDREVGDTRHNLIGVTDSKKIADAYRSKNTPYSFKYKVSETSLIDKKSIKLPLQFKELRK